MNVRTVDRAPISDTATRHARGVAVSDVVRVIYFETMVMSYFVAPGADERYRSAESTI
jgi:hypothetical protein